MKPIIFNTQMVQAIIDGTKTVTRRPIKIGKQTLIQDLENYDHSGVAVKPRGVPKGFQIFTNQLRFGCDRWEYYDDCGPGFKVGDLLYVRETFRVKSWNNDDGWIKFEYKVDDGNPALPVYLDDEERTLKYILKAFHEYDQHPDIEIECESDEHSNIINKTGINPCSWKPSIHMPKEVSRITLKVTEIKAERLHDIDEAGAKAEGAPLGRFIGIGRIGINTHREGFANIWQDIYLDWGQNPWVWAIKFEVVKK